MKINRKCPFCGGNKAVTVFAHGSAQFYFDLNGSEKYTPVLFAVKCLDCHAQTGAYESAKMAREAWEGKEVAKN